MVPSLSWQDENTSHWMICSIARDIGNECENCSIEERKKERLAADENKVAANQFAHQPIIDTTLQMAWHGKAGDGELESTRVVGKMEEDHGEGEGCSLCNKGG